MAAASSTTMITLPGETPALDVGTSGVDRAPEYIDYGLKVQPTWKPWIV